MKIHMFYSHDEAPEIMDIYCEASKSQQHDYISSNETDDGNSFLFGSPNSN